LNSDSYELLARGTLVTIEVTIAAALLAAVVAFLAGVGRASRVWVLRAISGAFIEVFRGTSAVVQLYVAFFVLPFAGLTLTPFVAGVLAVGLNSGSYGAEIVRAGLQSVPTGQLEAAIALDMPQWQRFWRVTWPNAMLIILRPAGNQLIDLLKLTSIVSLVTLHEATYAGLSIRSATGETAKAFFALLVIYFILASAIAKFIDLLERRVRRGIDSNAKPRRSEAAKNAEVVS
jgi:polar amino acid transport system permease protein